MMDGKMLFFFYFLIMSRWSCISNHTEHTHTHTLVYSLS